VTEGKLLQKLQTGWASAGIESWNPQMWSQNATNGPVSDAARPLSRGVYSQSLDNTPNLKICAVKNR